MLYRLIACWHLLAAVFRRRRLDRELEDELAFHVAMREADLARSGCSPPEARTAARRRFGNPARVKEELREMWTFPSAESVWQDVRYALRTLGRAPAFTLVAVATLALGIGGTTAIYSLGRAASVDSLPFADPDRLVQLWGTVERERVERRGASYPDFLDWRAQATAFEDMAAFDTGTVTMSEGAAERVPIEAVSAGYFALLGVAPAAGRTFQPGEDVTGGGDTVALLSDGLWQRHFGGDRSVIGRHLLLDGRPVTIVGVMPPGFQGLSDRAQLWLPFTRSQSPQTLANRGTRGFSALARLKPDVTRERAQQELDTISRRLEIDHPATNGKRAVEVSPLAHELFGDLRPALQALMAAVALVLVMGCAGVGNLLLARADARQREIAVRAAIGASRARLMRQLATESLVLALLGAAAGLAVAMAAIRLLVVASPVTLPSFAQPALDARAALFAIVVAAASGLLLGLAPAAHARSARLSEALKESARGTGGRRSARLRSALVVAEISLAVVLLAGAGLMIRSVRNLSAIDPGFDASSVLTLRIAIPEGTPAGETTPPGAGITGPAVLDRVRALPGVVAASLASDLPLDGRSSAVFYAAEGQGSVTERNRPRAYVHRVTPDFFATLGIPFRSGRTFVEREAVPDTPAVIVSEGVAQRFWPGQEAVGKRIKLGSLDSDGPWREIIGVVADVKYRGLPENPTADPDIYFPVLAGGRELALAVRTAVPPAAVAAPLRAAVQALHPGIPVYNVEPLDGLVAAQSARSRFTMWLMGVFAAVALLLATLGVYGVMSYAVVQRTQEIGIRLTLGASGPDVLRGIFASGMRLLAAGLALGCFGAVLLQPLLSSQLFAVGALDPAAVSAVILLALAATAACAVPAARAMRIDPLTALRQE